MSEPTVEDGIAMLDRAGMTWRDVPSPDIDAPIWNGRYLRVNGMEGHDIIHDLTHWLVCAPSRRSRPNYGLGPDYAGGGWDIQPRVSERFSLREEVATCLVDISFHALYGWDWRGQADFYSLTAGRSIYSTLAKHEDALMLAIRRGVLTPDKKIAPSYLHIRPDRPER